MIFSKLSGSYWPNVELVANKCAAVVQEEARGGNYNQFLAGNSPSKDGKASLSQPKRNISPSKKMHESSPVKVKTNSFKESAGFEELRKPVPIKVDATVQQEEPLRASLKFVDNSAPVPDVIEEPKKATPRVEPAKPAPAEKKDDYKLQEPEVVLVPEPETICGRHLKKESDLKSFPQFNDGERGSLLCKYLTPEIWNEYKDQKDSCGVSFKTCILSGCQNTDSGIGVYAGSPAAYDQF